MNRETVFSLSWAYALRMSREKQFRCSAGALIDKFPKGTQSREEALFAEATFAGRSPKRAEVNRASSRPAQARREPKQIGPLPALRLLII